MTAKVTTSRRHRVGQIGILLAAACLILLTWIGTFSAMKAERRAAAAQVEAGAREEALAVGEKLNVQLVAFEQMVRLLEREWERDPDHFNFPSWRGAAVMLNDPSLDLFITDAAGVVRDSTNPQAVGLDLSGREFFAHEAARTADHGGMGIDRAGHGLFADQWSMTLVRRLDGADGGFRGIVGVSFRSGSIAESYRQSNAARDGILILVGKSGRLRAVSLPLHAEPGQSIAASDLYKATSTGESRSWIGPTPLDGIVRIHGFYRIPGRNVTVVVGFERRQAMRASDGWLLGAVAFAAGTTLIVLLIAALLWRDLRQVRRRERRMAQDRDAIESAYAELKRAKQQADAKGAQLEATFASMADGVSLLDRDMRLIQWNARFCELTGLAPAELRVGMPFTDVLRRKAAKGELGPGDPDAEVERRMDLLSKLQGLAVTERVRPDGTAVELRRAPLPGGGFVTVYRDITMRKQAEHAQSLARTAAETMAKEKSRFAAMVSHEIRTPLNTLLNSIDILGRSALSPKDREIVELARHAGDALHVLLDDILELSRLDAGRFSLRPCWFGVEALLGGVLDLLRREAVQRGIVFRLDIRPDVPPRLYADPARLRQVLMNFLSNAVKFSVPGEVTIAACLEGVGSVRIAVSDPGPQIAEVDRDLLFRAFSRVEPADGQSEPGSGLGLAICRRLMALAGGDIGYEARASGSNVFWLTLPICAPAGAAPADAVADPSPLPVLPRTRVLVVDDVRGNQTVAVKTLEHAGHAVDVAGSCAEAVAAASRASYDIVFLDLCMPGADGFETAGRLRAVDGFAGTTPIIALTAQTDAETRQRCLASGMQDVLEKPLNSRALLDTIRRWVWEGGRAAPVVSAAPEDGDAGPVLSPSRLSALRETISDAELSRMFDACITDLAGRLPVLRTALGDGDSQAAAGLLHAMRGVAASYGLQALGDRVRALQTSLGKGEAIDPAAACAALENDLARIRSVLREMFASEPAM
ncbi:MAG: PAS-domain containing protein [Acetobacteraceae bacterium]|nr:PAS-domain containing protein [Acetobacteraceae bacterium]